MVENQGKFKKGEEVAEQEEEIMKFFSNVLAKFFLLQDNKKVKKEITRIPLPYSLHGLN